MGEEFFLVGEAGHRIDLVRGLGDGAYQQLGSEVIFVLCLVGIGAVMVVINRCADGDCLGVGFVLVGFL